MLQSDREENNHLSDSPILKMTATAPKRTASGILKYDDKIIDDTSDEELFTEPKSKKQKFECNLSPINDKTLAQEDKPKKKSSFWAETHGTPPNFAVPAPKSKSKNQNILIDLSPEAIEISDYDSEDQDEQDAPFPSWAKKKNIDAMMKNQITVDPETAFGRLTQRSMSLLDTIFDSVKISKRNRKKSVAPTSWTPDRLKQTEIENYNRKMGYIK